MIVCGPGTCAVVIEGQVIGGKSHLPCDGCDEHVGMVIFCTGKGLCKVV